MDVDVEPRAGDSGVRANAAAGLVSTAPEEQAAMVNARETIGAVRLKVVSHLCQSIHVAAYDL